MARIKINNLTKRCNFHKPRPQLQFDRRIFTAKIHTKRKSDFYDYPKIANIMANVRKDSMAIKKKEERYTKRTKELFVERRRLRDQTPTAKNLIEFCQTSKLLRFSIAEDLRKKHLDVVREAVRYGHSTRKALRSTQIGITHLNQLAKPDGSIATSRKDLKNVVKTFYDELYASNQRPSRSKYISNESFLPILKSEVEYSIKRLKDGKSPGPDKISAETLVRLFNEWIRNEEVPDQLANSTVSLIFKKGNHLDIANYRPISLLNLIYKVFTSTIDTRIERTLNASQPCEQAGFRKKNYSTLDHSFALNELISRCEEYNFPCYMVFVDYCKAFDSIEFGAVWKALQSRSASKSDQCYEKCVSKRANIRES